MYDLIIYSISDPEENFFLISLVSLTSITFESFSYFKYYYRNYCFGYRIHQYKDINQRFLESFPEDNKILDEKL